MRSIAAVAVLAIACAGLSGCARRGTTYLDTEADFDLIRRIAVLPLDNLAGNFTAAEKVRQLLIIELLSTGSVEVVDVGEVARALRDGGISNPVSPGTEEIRKLGEVLRVQGVIAGTVQEFSEVRSGGATSTQVSLAFRMIETDAGRVIWSSSVSRSGVGAMTRLFGVGGDSPTERARDLIREALKGLVK